MRWKDIPLWLRWGLVSAFIYIASIIIVKLFPLWSFSTILIGIFFFTLVIILLPLSAIDLISDESVLICNSGECSFYLNSTGYIIEGIFFIILFSLIGYFVQRKKNKKFLKK